MRGPQPSAVNPVRLLSDLAASDGRCYRHAEVSPPPANMGDQGGRLYLLERVPAKKVSGRGAPRRTNLCETEFRFSQPGHAHSNVAMRACCFRGPSLRGERPDYTSERVGKDQPPPSPPDTRERSPAPR